MLIDRLLINTCFPNTTILVYYRKYLQLYLNEFVYKLNRRYFEEKLFDRLVIANITGL